MILYASSRTFFTSIRSFSSPMATKSSPWTVRLMSFTLCLKRHGFAMPLTNPAATNFEEYSSAQFRAASRVPYMENASSPHVSAGSLGS